MRVYEQIIAGHIRFPPSSPSFHLNTVSRQFILALCRTDPAQRLGHIAGGSARVMAHPFFDGVDWDALYYKKVRGPIIPRVEWEGDAGNFDDYPDPDPDPEPQAFSQQSQQQQQPGPDSDQARDGMTGSDKGRPPPMHYTEELRREYDSCFEDF